MDDPRARWLNDMLGPAGDGVARETAEFLSGGMSVAAPRRERAMRNKLPADEIVALVRVLWVSDLWARALLWTLELYKGQAPRLFSVETHGFFGNPVFSRGQVQLLRAHREPVGDRIRALNHRLLLVEYSGQKYLQDEFFQEDCDDLWCGFEMADHRVKWAGVHAFLTGLGNVGRSPANEGTSGTEDASD